MAQLLLIAAFIFVICFLLEAVGQAFGKRNNDFIRDDAYYLHSQMIHLRSKRR